MNQDDDRHATRLSPSRHVLFGLYLAALTLSFAIPLTTLFNYAARTHLYSHILLIPGISVYLLYLNRKHHTLPPMTGGRALAFPLVGVAVAAIACHIILAASESLWSNDRLCILTFAFVTLVLAGTAIFYGSSWLRANAFPLLFLYFMAPLPLLVEGWVATLLQYLSAEASYTLLVMEGTPVFRDGLVFKLPGLAIEVAQECSGIRSTLILFITSLLAGHLFLRSHGRRAILALSVLPIAILRNSARIAMVALVTVHMDPGAISGPLHRRGGTPFFVLSLIPLFAILLILRRKERLRDEASSPEES